MRGVRGGRLVHRRGAHRDRREPPAEARHQAEEVAEQPHLALGHRTPRKKHGQQERGRNAREGRHEARPLNGRETLLGELDREPDRRKEGGRVEQHRNVRGVRVLEAERHEEEFARKAQAHLEGVRELHVHVPLLPEPEAVGTPEQEGRAARAQGHLHQGADVGRARLDGGVMGASRARLRRETHILRLTAVQDFAVSCLLTRISLRSAIMSSAAMKRNAVSSDLCWAMKPSRAGPAIRPP